VPTGTDVWRTAIAMPRRSAGNQVRTARPLAALTLAPDAPASASSTPATTGSVVEEAAVSATAAPASPTAMTPRSPKRSVALPHAMSVPTRPTEMAPSSAPTPATLRPKCARSAGVTAESPRKYAAVAACAAVPTASTT
jgi:hypothetical protein